MGDDPNGDRDSAESGKDGNRIFPRRMTLGDQWCAVRASPEVCVLIADRQNVALMDVYRRPERATAITAMAAANFTLPSNLTLPLYARGVER